MNQDYPASSTEPVCSRPVDAMTTLSPAAAAIYSAVLEICPAPADEIAAAALRAAADQVAPRTPEPAGSIPTAAWHRWNARGVLRLNLLAIAAELEGAQ